MISYNNKISSRSQPQNRQKINHQSLVIWTLRGISLITGTIVVLITIFLVLEALPALREIGLSSFLSDSSWHPLEGLYNLTPMILGSLAVTFGSVIIATPLGILSAIFCQYYAPPILASLYRSLIELLAGIPSVVYGFWGLVVLVPLINRWHPPGTSLLAGILILTLMILPTIALTADASLSQVPRDYLLGATSLGISPWGKIWDIALPTAKSGLITGVILEVGRAIGETMAVLMVCGNVVQTPDSIFAPIRTLTANIALEMAYAVGNHRSALFVSGLFLMAAIGVLAIIAEVSEQLSMNNNNASS